MTSPYDDHSLSTSNINRPQIMKIYKLNKNATVTQNNININSDLLSIQNLSVSQKKLNITENTYNTNVKK